MSDVQLLEKVPIWGVYVGSFDRVAGRRGKLVAIVAVARRMLEDAVRMSWKDEAFRYVSAAKESFVADTPRSDSMVASSVAG